MTLKQSQTYYFLFFVVFLGVKQENKDTNYTTLHDYDYDY